MATYNPPSSSGGSTPNMSSTSAVYTTSTANSQHKERIVDIIDEIVSLREDDDYNYKTPIKSIVLHARRALKDFHFNATREMRAMRYTVPQTGAIKAPLDMVEPFRVSMLDSNGFLYPVYENRNVKITQEYLLDDQNDIVFDNDGYFITTDSTAFPQNFSQVVSSDINYGYINIQNNLPKKFEKIKYLTYDIHMTNTSTNETQYQTLTYYIPDQYEEVDIVDVESLLASSDFLTRIESLENVASAEIGVNPTTSGNESFYVTLVGDWTLTATVLPRLAMYYEREQDYSVFKMSRDYLNTIGQGGAAGARGGVYAGTGFYQYYRQFREFRFFDLVGQDVVVEYVSDPFLEGALDTMYVHQYFVDALKERVYYETISKKSNVPYNEKVRARRAYQSAYRKAKKMIGMHNIERINQVIRRGRNIHKW